MQIAVYQTWILYTFLYFFHKICGYYPHEHMQLGAGEASLMLSPNGTSQELHVLRAMMMEPFANPIRHWAAIFVGPHQIHTLYV